MEYSADDHNNDLNDGLGVGDLNGDDGDQQDDDGQDNKVVDSSSEDESKKWPRHTDIHPNGKGSINITHRKNRAVRPLLKMLIDEVTQMCLTIDAYPEIPHKLQYLKKVLLKCAAELEDVTIRERIKQDHEYFLLLRTVVSLHLHVCE